MGGAPHQSCDMAFTLRPAASGDEAAIRALVEAGGMMMPCDWVGGTVAVDSQDAVIGYVRVQQTDRGPHVAPVAVRADWQGRGVGRALMDDAAVRAGGVKLVSQGSAAGFYRALGCSEISFDDISDELDEDCKQCPDAALCQPVAFFYTGKVNCG